MLKQRHIIVVTTEIGLNAGGLAKSCVALQELLQSSNILVTIIKSSQVKNSLEDESIVVERSNKKSETRDLQYIASIRHYVSLFSTKVDAVIAWGARYNGVFALNLAQYLDVPLITSLRGSDINLTFSNETNCIFNQMCLQNSSAIVSTSQEISKKAKTFLSIPCKNMKIIPNSMDIGTTPIKSPSQKSTFRFGIGARYLNEKKGVGYLLKSFKALQIASNYKYTLELVGQMDVYIKPNYLELIASLDLKDTVILHGRLEREAFLNVMKQWDFYLQTSWAEGCSNSVIEALSVGIPVVLTNTGYFAEKVAERAPSFLIPNWTKEAFISTIEQLYRIDTQYELQALQKYLCVELRPSKVRQQWLQLLEEIFGLRGE